MGYGRPRFPLGILMVYIALVAIILNPLKAPWFPTSTTIPYAIAQCAEVAILLAYRRLSRWIWIIIASKVCHTIGQLMFEVTFGMPALPAYRIPICLGYFLFVVGLGMSLRDMGRQLANTENRASPRPNARDLG